MRQLSSADGEYSSNLGRIVNHRRRATIVASENGEGVADKRCSIFGFGLRNNRRR